MNGYKPTSPIPDRIDPLSVPHPVADPGMLTAEDRRRCRDMARTATDECRRGLDSLALMRDGGETTEGRAMLACTVRDLAAAIRDLDAVSRGAL